MKVAEVPLGEVAEFVRGITFKPENVVDPGTSGSVVCLRTKNVQTEVDLDDLWAVPASLVKRENQYLCYGDVLISSANSWNLVGKCSWIPELPWSASFGGFVTVLRPRDERVGRRYLYHWFNHGRTQQLLRSFGRKTTNISNLDLDRCRRMPFPLPPIEEQRRIAAVLDAADSLRAKRRLALSKLDALTHAIFIDMFGDPGQRRFSMIPIGELVRTGITRGIDQPGPDVEGGVPYIKTTDFSPGIPVRETLARAAPEIAASFPRSVVEVGDTVICIRATVGPTLLVSDDLAGVNLSRGTARISPSSDVLPDYLFAAINTDHFQHQIEERLRGATFLQIPLRELKALEVLVPPMTLQQELADARAMVEQQISEARSQLEHIDTLFASLQQGAFRGEL